MQSEECLPASSHLGMLRQALQMFYWSIMSVRRLMACSLSFGTVVFFELCGVMA